jgi:bacterioferritin-associated ferredoxin
VVSDKSVDAAITEGNRTVSSVCRSTGAGQDCGGCIFTLKAMVCQHRDDLSSDLEVADAAS